MMRAIRPILVHPLGAHAALPPLSVAAHAPKVTVNGEGVEYKLDPDTPLLWALRDSSNLTGTKYGCDSRDCGACTVIVDGRAAASCALRLATLKVRR